MTFIDIATDAYRIAGIISEIESPPAEMGAKAVRRFNAIMSSLAEDGIDLGYAPISSTGDTVLLPDGHVLGLTSMLAVSLCSDFGFEVPQVAALQAQEGRQKLLRQAVMLKNTPVTLRSVHTACELYDITRGY